MALELNDRGGFNPVNDDDVLYFDTYGEHAQLSLADIVASCCKHFDVSSSEITVEPIHVCVRRLGDPTAKHFEQDYRDYLACSRKE